jgi:hypothetical protein
MSLDHEPIVFERMHQNPPDVSILPPGVHAKACEFMPFWDFTPAVQYDEKDVLREGNLKPRLVFINKKRLESVEALGFFDSLMVPLVCISGDR